MKKRRRKVATRDIYVARHFQWLFCVRRKHRFSDAGPEGFMAEFPPTSSQAFKGLWLTLEIARRNGVTPRKEAD